MMDTPRSPRVKALFWTLLGAFLAMTFVPSVILLEKVQEYARFLSGWNPGTLRSVRTRQVPHGGGPGQRAPELHFVEFRLRAPNAADVLLAGDFNRWKPQTLPLAREGKGDWEVLVPLPPGKYQYLFQVDGQWARDPQATGSGLWQGLQTSMRQVP